MSIYTNHLFQSPTLGTMTIDEVKETILSYMEEEPTAQYRLVIGTDSQPKNGYVDFVTALVVHKIGSGGIYFWKRTVEKKKYVLKERIYTEASMSLSFATDFFASFKNNGISSYEIEIHVDIGNVGETRVLIAEVVGMIRGSGFTVRTKPDSYGASKVADRHT